MNITAFALIPSFNVKNSPQYMMKEICSMIGTLNILDTESCSKCVIRINHELSTADMDTIEKFCNENNYNCFFIIANENDENIKNNCIKLQ